MCLIDKKQFRIAEKDIPIFKVVLNKKYSPFMNVLLLSINQTKDEEVDVREQKINGTVSGYIFDKGFYHAFISQTNAERAINELRIQLQIVSNFNPKNTLSIVEGYIPKGIRYAMDEYGCICARKIILNL